MTKAKTKRTAKRTSRRPAWSGSVAREKFIIIARYAAVVGVLQMKIHLLCDEASERGDEAA